jgi:hypothetical protein
MDSRLTWEAVEAMVAERRRQADSARLAADARAGRASSTREATRGPAEATVRYANSGDTLALERLAQLDCGSMPAGPALVAEVDGVIVAALPLVGGRALADPFRPTAGLVRLLERQAARLRRGGREQSRRLRVGRVAGARAARAHARPHG